MGFLSLILKKKMKNKYYIVFIFYFLIFSFWDFIFNTEQFIIIGANYLEGTIKTVWIGPMAQSEDIIPSEDGQIKL